MTRHASISSCSSFSLLLVSLLPRSLIANSTKSKHHKTLMLLFPPSAATSPSPLPSPSPSLSVSSGSFFVQSIARLHYVSIFSSFSHHSQPLCAHFGGTTGARAAASADDNAECWTPNGAERRTANAPFRSVWAAIYLWACCVHEYFVCCCCLMLLLLPLPLLVDATYTGFGRLGALKTCLIYKMTASSPLPLFRRTFHLDCVRGQSAGVVKSAIHCRCIVAANFTLEQQIY